MNRHDRRAQEASLKKIIDVGPTARTRVALVQDEHGNRFFRVKLDSRAKPMRCMHADVSVNESHIVKKLCVVGGALAETMNTKYGDKFDPDRIAVGVAEVFADLRKRLELGKGEASDNKEVQPA